MDNADLITLVIVGIAVIICGILHSFNSEANKQRPNPLGKRPEPSPSAKAIQKPFPKPSSFDSERPQRNEVAIWIVLTKP